MHCGSWFVPFSELVRLVLVPRAVHAGEFLVYYRSELQRRCDPRHVTVSVYPCAFH